VLGKLRYFKQGSPNDLQTLRRDIDPWPIVLAQNPDTKQSDWTLTPAASGTLGAGFVARAAGKDVFLKTHILPDGGVALSREIGVLQALYADQMRIERLASPDVNSEQVWLAMPVLERISHGLARDALQESLRICVARLEHHPLDCRNSFATYLNEANLAVAQLRDAGLITPQTLVHVEASLALLAREAHNLQPRLCHGDLGPENLLSHDGALIIADWEDAFIGFEGYDFLYYLTFFANRQYRHPDFIWGQTRLSPRQEAAVLIMILVLKSTLSVLAGTHHSNSLTIDQRLMEVVNNARDWA
jgi:thiamine kinase-like enzyme